MPEHHTVAVVCGGVGAARFLRGLIDAIDEPSSITAIVNTGAECSLHVPSHCWITTAETNRHRSDAR